ncbi:nucleoside/nucleotide kinase family protein [Brucella sp. BE17]|uniref:nucleoside/nucleotide kinase family protein n=1 Tax=Brucella sp. BE17 TaxID=3142977 RepID=UPI0031BA9F2F
MVPIERKELVAKILARSAATHDRLIVAIAGPPGSGKSTIADYLCKAINQGADYPAIIVPMDGFHLDDSILDKRGLKSRKGSPPTFDCAGFAALLERLKAAQEDVFIPVFDRSLELSRAAASVVTPQHRILLVEGNYLLLDEEPWSRLGSLFDLTVALDVPLPILERRLVDRWLHYGFDPDAARAKAHANDLPNAERVITYSRKADYILSSTES